MADKITPDQRSWNMSRIKSANTKPELILRSALHKLGFRYRIHYKGLPGRPDIVLPKYKTVIFVHGCFWHQHPGCVEASRPKTNQHYWESKLNKNVQRDLKNKELLTDMGWKVLRFWECQIEKDPGHIAKHVANILPNLKTQ